MRAFKKLLFAALIIVPTFLPTQTRANGLIDWIIGLFDPKPSPPQNNGGNCNPGTPGNSVPLDGGIVILFAAGLGLGAKMIYDTNKRKATVNSTI